MTKTTIVRAVLALIAAVVLAGFLWQAEKQTSQHAQALLANGEKTMAEVTGASIKSRKKFGVTTSRRADVEYEFTAKDGTSHQGSNEIDAKLVDDMSDPTDDTRLKDDAAVEIVYLASNPSDNGVLAQLTAHREVNYMTLALSALIAAAVVWFGSGRILGWFNRS